MESDKHQDDCSTHKIICHPQFDGSSGGVTQLAGITVTGSRSSGESSSSFMNSDVFNDVLAQSLEVMVGGNLLLMGGEFGAGEGSAGRFFYNPRPFKQISKEYWAANGPAAGRSLHHWLFPQSASAVPLGFRNAGFNLLELPGLRGAFHETLTLNSWMGFARNWGLDSAFRASLVESSVREGVMASTIGSAYGGYELGSVISEDWGQ